jgi:hypothetical protein
MGIKTEFERISYRSKLRRAAAALAVLVFVLSISGCTDTPATSSPADSSSGEPAPTRTAESAQCRPVKIAPIPDQTGSANWTRTPQLAADDLRPLFELLLKCGGEIGFGLIRDQSNRGLIRFKIPPPSPRPLAPPLSPDDDEFTTADKNEAYREMFALWEQEIKQRREKYAGEFETYLQTLQPLLAQRPKGRSDIWGAIGRADLFLSERDEAWGQATRRYLILITDGQDNVGKKPKAFKSEAQVLLVNASENVKAESLQSLQPIRFESTMAAVEHIVAAERGK